MRGAVAIMAAALLLGGCAGGPKPRATVGPVKFRKLGCPGLDRERRRVERETGRLFVSLRTRRVFGDKDEAEVLALWPTLLFLRGPDGPDAKRLRTLQSDYEGLRAIARERGCDARFSDTVSGTVARGARSPETRRINQVVEEETQR